MAGFSVPVKPTPEYLRECFDYNPETGALAWKARPKHHFGKERNWKSWLVRFEGKTTGSLSPLGYLITVINNKTYCAHRVAWTIAKDRWPQGEVDHINGKRSDNRLSNLREVTSAQNSWNLSWMPHNTSGVKGVAWCSRRNTWRARIRHQEKDNHLGYFDSKEEAVNAVREARTRFHGAYANHGSPPPPLPYSTMAADDFEV